MARLSEELDHLGYNVVSHGDHVCVRLPLFSSVRIRRVGEHFRFAPQFGPVGRTRAFLFTSALTLGAVGVSAVTLGTSPTTLILGFLGVVALAHDACRFIVTEGALTRLQQLLTRQTS